MSRTEGLQLDTKSWAELDQLLEHGLDLPNEARARWLSGLETPLKPMLLSLLERADALESRPFTLGAPMVSAVADEPNESAGDSVGPYELIRELGVGGMARVWLAHRKDGLIDRPVALKLPRVAGNVQSFAYRLSHERDILATLAHPNIARLYDAGLTELGQPYIAMEFVDGVPIDAYCDRNGLDLRSRIDLFVQVTHAVAYAHANLIIHRDLKPGNVLVDASGQVRLLDFGIAALLSQGEAVESEATRLTGRAMTVPYAAPEQVSGQPTTIQSDVYALGVLLFRMLTEDDPYRPERDSQAALEDAILHSDPRMPSAAAKTPVARRFLRGDIDAIVLKAMQKTPAARYATVGDFTSDLERHRTGQPVLAQKYSTLYRVRKFVSRHKTIVTLVATTVVLLAAATAVTSRQLVVAQQQRDIALNQHQRAQANNEFLSMLLEHVGREDRPLSMREMLDEAASMLELQYGEARFVGRSYLELAQRFSDVGLRATELDMLAKAQRHGRANDEPDLLAAALCESASTTLLEAPQSQQAERDLAEARTLLAASPFTIEEDHAVCHLAFARFHETKGRRDLVGEELLKALALLNTSSASRAPSTLHSRVLVRLADYRMDENDPKAALAAYARARRLLENSGRARTLRYTNLLQNQAVALAMSGELGNALNTRRDLLEQVRHVSPTGEVPDNFEYGYGLALLSVGRYQAALEQLQSIEPSARQSGNSRFHARVQMAIGGALVRLERAGEAQAYLSTAERVLARDPETNFVALQNITKFRVGALLGGSRHTEARELMADLLTRLGYPETRSGVSLITTLAIAARLELSAEEYERAVRYGTDMYDLAMLQARDAQSSAYVGMALLYRGQALMQLNDLARARADLRQAHTILANSAGRDSVHTTTAGAALALAEAAKDGAARRE